MIPKECKRLAEVDFPIAQVSKHAMGEGTGRPGHPWTFHKWWARRPLPSTRAMLMALLLPDTCDRNCPARFKNDSRKIILEMHGRPKSWEERVKTDIGLRRVLLEFIADFAKTKNGQNALYLQTSRALITAAHGDDLPLVVDPFAGGGSIPLEALRIGCDAFASDLNPVACLMLKALLDEIPRYGLELAEKLRRLGNEIELHAKRSLGDLYPSYDDGTAPIAYLWARTVRCEAPDCGAEIPLTKSFWLAKSKLRRRALRSRIVKEDCNLPHPEFEVFEPKVDTEVDAPTVKGSSATAKCVCCGTVLHKERVRAQLAVQRGGADTVFDERGNRIGGARLMAVVTVEQGRRGRQFRLPSREDYAAVFRAQSRLEGIEEEWIDETGEKICPYPNEPLPPIGTLGFRVQRYGMEEWGDLFSARQKVALIELSNEIRNRNGSNVDLMLACALNRVAMSDMSCTRWNATGEKMQHTFGRQALPIVWDFAEVVVTAEAPGNWRSGFELIAKVVESIHDMKRGQVEICDATAHPLPDQAAHVWFTDPPYYDAVPYADLSDFFLVWLKRTLPRSPLLRDPFEPDNPLSQKGREVVQDETKCVDGEVKDGTWFEETMSRAFAEGRRVLLDEGIGSVVFAHKTTEGWEALLSGMTRGGWTITGSWPIATEMATRLRARESAALATSVHLICRPRPEDAPIGDWANVLRELPGRVGEWMERLQGEGIRGADLVFACVGPALEVFSRYSSVETAEGDEIGLPTYLERVWEVVGRTALENVLGTAEARARNGQTGVLEEDARLTALFLWTLQSTDTNTESGANDGEEAGTNGAKKAKGFNLPFDVVRRFAQPMGINLETWTDRVIGQSKGVVRLIPVNERGEELFGKDGTSAAADWIETDPARAAQLNLFPEPQAVATPRKGRGRKKAIVEEGAELQTIDATTLDRVHAAMLLQASGRATALRNWIEEEQQRGPDFVRLANSLSALYPKGSDEKRLLDAMLLAVPR